MRLNSAIPGKFCDVITVLEAMVEQREVVGYLPIKFGTENEKWKRIGKDSYCLSIFLVECIYLQLNAKILGL